MGSVLFVVDIIWIPSHVVRKNLLPILAIVQRFEQGHFNKKASI